MSNRMYHKHLIWAEYKQAVNDDNNKFSFWVQCKQAVSDDKHQLHQIECIINLKLNWI